MPLSATVSSELRRDADVKRLLTSRSSRQPELIRAFTDICDHPEINDIESGRQSFLSTSDAICDGIKIFISYHMATQQTAASMLLSPFETYGNGRIKVDHNPFPFVCDTAGLQGLNFKAAIHGALQRAHWLFLLVPDESIDRSWTAFEAGFFDRDMHPTERLICIHHPLTKPLSPLEGFDRVEANELTIYELLDRLLRKPNAVPGMDAINPALDNKILEDHASLIAAQFLKSSIDIQSYVVFCRLQFTTVPTRPLDLGEMTIVDSLDLNKVFSCAASSLVGTKFCAVINQNGSKGWLNELSEVVEGIMNDKSKNVEQLPVVLLGVDNRFYEPVVHSIERSGAIGGPVSVRIEFHQTNSGPIRNAPRDLDAVNAALRLAYRFRYEILDRFDNMSEEEDVRRLKRVWSMIEREAIQRRFWGNNDQQNRLIGALTKEEKSLVLPLLAEAGTVTKTGGEADQVFQALDPILADRMLQKMRPYQAKFLRLLSQIHHRLILEYIRE